ncbi:Cation/H(+) antiporter 21 [Cardamine amara subsp. amara]|uniref:Cation/H(+) antiporter 21 n=1 Tax=Cardamine amara subsp. amara TaxID=228776 RepID=A0ABD1BVE7_CARAN
MADPVVSEPQFSDISASRFGRVVCYNQTEMSIIGDHKGWESGNMFEAALPFFVTQICVANLCYRILYYFTRFLYLPPFVAQILCGLVFSPTVLGKNEWILTNVFPYRFTMVLETFANLALVYNMFLLGLGMDLRMIKIKDKKPVIIAIVGLIVASLAGFGLYYLPSNGDSDKILAGGVYWSIAFGCTNFPDLARILADLKLLRSDMGRIAMCAAIITDTLTWILFIFGLAGFTKAGVRSQLMLYPLLSTLAFTLLCYFVIHPGISYVFNNTVEGGHVGESHVWFILAGVILCGLITEACGVKSITGAFLFGLSIPQDHMIRKMIEEKLHDFLAGILMPLFYIICGLRADLGYMSRFLSVGTMAFVISSSFMVKIVSTVVCSIFLRMPLRDGFAIGALMNTKGTMALVILNAGRDNKSLDVIMYTHMTMAFLVMSMLVQPILAFAYTPKKKLVFYKNRTIQNHKGESELSVLSCVHDLPNVSGITNLLQVSNPTKQSPLNVYALHLVELTDRTAASLLIMNDESKPKASFSDRVRAESEVIAETFSALEVNNEEMLVQTITAVSPYETMHEDICLMAEDKQVSFILLPYHKNLTSDGRLGEGNAAHGEINQNVLSHAPCSVGILVDRGMTDVRSGSSSFKGETVKKEIAMLFLGGRDDREALAYAWRMVGQQMVNLTVVRFVPGREALVSAGKAMSEYEKETIMDEEFIYEFNFKTMNDTSVNYIENVVNNGQEAIEVLRELEDNNFYDLYIVGRSYKVESPVTAGLVDWTSTPDLGTIGDTLAQSNFIMQASVLVIQQYSASNGQTSNNQELVEGGTKPAHEAKPFMKSHEDEEPQYHIGMRK